MSSQKLRVVFSSLAVVAVLLVLVSSRTATQAQGLVEETAEENVLTVSGNPVAPNLEAIALLKFYAAAQGNSFQVGSVPVAVAFDGSSIWVANESNGGPGTVTKLRASDGGSLGTFNVGISPRGIAFDGAAVWVVNRIDDTITKLRPSDGSNLGTFATGKVPIGAAFDGANIWVANALDDTASKL